MVLVSYSTSATALNNPAILQKDQKNSDEGLTLRMSAQ